MTRVKDKGNQNADLQQQEQKIGGGKEHQSPS